jgi:hypothetical protein
MLIINAAQRDEPIKSIEVRPTGELNTEQNDNKKNTMTNG